MTKPYSTRQIVTEQDYKGRPRERAQWRFVFEYINQDNRVHLKSSKDLKTNKHHKTRINIFN